MQPHSWCAEPSPSPPKLCYMPALPSNSCLVCAGSALRVPGLVQRRAATPTLRCNAEVDRRAFLAAGSAVAIAGVPQSTAAAQLSIKSDEWEVVCTALPSHNESTPRAAHFMLPPLTTSVTQSDDASCPMVSSALPRRLGTALVGFPRGHTWGGCRT